MRRLIERYAHTLNVPVEIDRGRFLAALAMAESSGGRDTRHRYEKAYDIGGRYAEAPHVQEAINRWEQIAVSEYARGMMREYTASSWGPWQILYIVALELGFKDPPFCLSDPEMCLIWVLKLLNNRLVPKLHETTPEGVVVRLADAYNSGSPYDGNTPTAYITRVWKEYRDEDVLDRLAKL